MTIPIPSEGALEVPEPQDPTAGPLVSVPHQLIPVPIHPALNPTPNAWALLKGLRKRWLPALIVGTLAAAAVGIGVWSFKPTPRLTARALLHVAYVPPKIFFPTSDGNPFDAYQRTQVFLLKSRFVLNTALKNPEVSKLAFVREELDPITWLEKELRVDFPSGPEILRVSLQGNDAQELLAIVNSVVKAYLDEIVNKEHNKKMEQHNTLRKLLSDWEGKIQDKKETQFNLAKQTGSKNPKTLALKQQLEVAAIAQAKAELVNYQSQLRILRVKIAGQAANAQNPWLDQIVCLYCCPPAGLAANLVVAHLLQVRGLTGANTEVSEKAVADYIQDDLVTQKHQNRVKSLEDSIRRHLSVSPAPLPPKYNKDLADAKKALEQHQKMLRPLATEEIRRKAYFDSQNGLGPLRAEAAVLEQLEKKLLADIVSLSREGEQNNERSLRLENLTEDLDRWTAMTTKLREQIETLDVERFAPQRVTPLEDAVVIRGDAGSRHMMMAGVAGAGAFGLVLFFFGWWEFRSFRVNSTDQVVHGLGIKLIGTVPDFTQRPRRWLRANRAVTATYWDNLLADSVDGVRAMLLFSTKEQNLKKVLVTSAISGEGKTFSACHLAASLARAGRKTLLIDCDLRKPAAHRLFELESAPGFSELLREQQTPESVIQTTRVPNLFLVPAGIGDPIAIQALAQNKAAAILEYFTGQFDFIVIDTSPVLPISDTLHLAQHADGVVFSVLRGKSQVPKVYAAYQRLSLLGNRMLGAIVNGTEAETYAGYSYSYIP